MHYRIQMLRSCLLLHLGQALRLQLMAVLDKRKLRVVDLFSSWDGDENGTVTTAAGTVLPNYDSEWKNFFQIIKDNFQDDKQKNSERVYE